jgi:PIN domain nuclease of toxin-antitoxin system
LIVLDTHAWLWWLTAPERLSSAAAETIEQAPGIGVSTLSAWEIAMLVVRGRIALDRDARLWIGQALAGERVEPLAPGPDIAVAAALLDARQFPGDPIDRLIYATSRSIGATLVTRDEAIRAFDPGSTLW